MRIYVKVKELHFLRTQIFKDFIARISLLLVSGLASLATSSPLPPHSLSRRQVLLVGAREGISQQAESRQSNVEDLVVPAGEAVDIFYR